MERIKTLLAKYSHVAFLFLMGLILVIYLALGVLYLQQAPQQRDYQDKTDKLNLILKNPLPSVDKLNAERAAIDQALAPMADNITIAMLVSLAKKNGIDISEASAKFVVPVPSHGSSGSYQVVSFRGIRVQGDPDTVTSFIRVLDSDEKLETLESTGNRTVTRVVTHVAIEDVEAAATGQEGERRAEFRSILDAVNTMMKDNNLTVRGIPSPVTSPTNYMGDDLGTPLPLIEGFPDVTTTAAGKGYTGNTTPKQGYLLYQHDRISSDNTTLYTTVDYFPALRTTYYYTADANGTIHQWDGPILAMSKEYKDSQATKMELKASVDVDIYFTQVK